MRPVIAELGVGEWSIIVAVLVAVCVGAYLYGKKKGWV